MKDSKLKLSRNFKWGERVVQGFTRAEIKKSLKDEIAEGVKSAPNILKLYEKRKASKVDKAAKKIPIVKAVSEIVDEKNPLPPEKVLMDIIKKLRKYYKDPKSFVKE